MAPGADRVDTWLDAEFEDEDGFAERWRSFATAAGDDRSPRSKEPTVPETEDEDRSGPHDLAVVEQDLPGHLFGFTRRDSDHVTVNSALYRVDRESTIRHEKMHHRSPKDELTIRYLNGDLDVENTLSFQANQPSRVGRGNREGVPVAARDAGAAYRSGADKPVYPSL